MESKHSALVKSVSLVALVRIHYESTFKLMAEPPVASNHSDFMHTYRKSGGGVKKITP